MNTTQMQEKIAHDGRQHLPLRVHLGRRDASVFVAEFDDFVDVARRRHSQFGHSRKRDLCTLSSYLQTRQLAVQQVVDRLVVDFNHGRLCAAQSVEGRRHGVGWRGHVRTTMPQAVDANPASL